MKYLFLILFIGVSFSGFSQRSYVRNHPQKPDSSAFHVIPSGTKFPRIVKNKAGTYAVQITPFKFYGVRTAVGGNGVVGLGDETIFKDSVSAIPALQQAISLKAQADAADKLRLAPQVDSTAIKTHIYN